jgi:hypothetical protein
VGCDGRVPPGVWQESSASLAEGGSSDASCLPPLLGDVLKDLGGKDY